MFGNDVSQIEQWHGTLYAKLDGTDIAAWRHWLDYPFDLREGHGAAQFWVDFADNKIEAFTTDIALNKVVTRLPYNGVESSFKHIAGRIKWLRHQDGQEIQGEGIKIVTSDDLNMRSGKFSLSERKINQQKAVAGDVLLDEIQLETLGKLSPYFALPSNVEQALKETQPQGKLSHLHLTWRIKGEKLPEYSLRGEFNGLSAQPYTKYSLPGFTNLMGKIDIDQNKGKLSLDSKLATLNFEPLLRWTIPVENSQGKLTGELKIKV